MGIWQVIDKFRLRYIVKLWDKAFLIKLLQRLEIHDSAQKEIYDTRTLKKTTPVVEIFLYCGRLHKHTWNREKGHLNSKQ